MVRRAQQVGLSPVFLTDHDRIDGARSLLDAGNQDVIAGEEILTTEGELIGLFLRDAVPRGLSPLEAVAVIKAQGGLVYLEHPYDISRRNLREEAIERIAGQIDIVEVFNGRAHPDSNRRAADLRDALGVPAGAGSDAHTLAELGRVFIEMESFVGPQDFLEKLESARIVTKPHRWVMVAQQMVASHGPKRTRR
jgi:predicted metal-dependent phosphoesterase TrpH